MNKFDCISETERLVIRPLKENDFKNWLSEFKNRLPSQHRYDHAKLDKAIGAAVRSPDIIEKLHLGGCHVTYLDPQDFRSRISTETAMFGNIIQKGNIKLT